MLIRPQEPEFDAIVIGGSYAGQSTALQLARARRRVLLIDAGRRRNRYAEHSHGFLTRDGAEASAIAATGRMQLLQYPNLTWVDGTAARAVAQGDGFAVTLAEGTAFAARRLILASGVVDELPAIESLAERWGRSAFHCPYCHGYELDAGSIGVLAAGPISMHHADVAGLGHGDTVPE